MKFTVYCTNVCMTAHIYISSTHEELLDDDEELDDEPLEELDDDEEEEELMHLCTHVCDDDAFMYVFI